MNTKNFTATKDLFVAYPQIEYWRFEVIYSFPSEASSSSLNFIINQSPQNGSCSIDPLNGTTDTLFTISCLNWFDEHGIKDYSLYSINLSDQTIIAFSSLPDFQVRLPAGNDPTFLLQLFIYIRDTYDTTTRYNMSSVIVMPDTEDIIKLIHILQNSTNELTSNSFVQLLASENQNIVSQVITLISQQLNTMNSQSIQNAISNGVSATSVLVSSLTGAQSSQQVNHFFIH